MTEPKRIGRPPSPDPFKRLTVTLRVSELELLDRIRGEESRPAYMRSMLLAKRAPSPSVAQMAPVRAATERKIQDAISSFRPHPKAGKK